MLMGRIGGLWRNLAGLVLAGFSEGHLARSIAVSTFLLPGTGDKKVFLVCL